MRRPMTLLLALMLLLPLPAAAFDHAAAVEAWRSERLARLQRPDGWLSLVGLHWVEPGRHTIGRDAGNDIVIATGPARLGEIHVAAASLQFRPAPEVVAWIDEQRVTDAVELAATPRPRLVFDGGAASLEVIERAGRHALRVRDANARSRTAFAGIEAYPVDAGWRHDARFERHPAGRTIDIVNVLGMTEALANPGAVVFERDGREYRLEAVDDGGAQLWAIFADRTNRHETYGGGRFIYFDRPTDDTTELDFNRAYNPPCAFTDHSTCPLPPPENRLDLAVTAGERRYTRPE